jgi:arginase family enzyme
MSLDHTWEWRGHSSDPQDEQFGHIVEQAALDEADDYDAVLVGEPYDGAVIGRAGAREGPAAIREALAKTKTHHFDAGPVESVADLGTVEIPGGESVSAVQAAVRKVTESIHAADTIPVFLGGDNSLTYANVAPLLSRERADGGYVTDGGFGDDEETVGDVEHFDPTGGSDEDAEDRDGEETGSADGTEEDDEASGSDEGETAEAADAESDESDAESGDSDTEPVDDTVESEDENGDAEGEPDSGSSETSVDTDEPAARGTERVGVVSLDAHLDFRAVDGQPTSGTPYRQLLDEGLDALAVLGARHFETTTAYATELREQGGEIITAEEVGEDTVEATDRALSAMEEVDAVYVSVDMDVLDTTAAPGVSAPTPGGITSRELFRMVRLLASDDRLAGIEIVETAPPLCPDGRTARAAARTVAHALSVTRST